MGFGLIKVVNKKMEFLQLNELILSKYDNHYQKLRVIFERTIELIDTHNPDEIAIEAPFFGKNVQSMLKLGRAQGVAMAAGLSRDIPITEYEPITYWDKKDPPFFLWYGGKDDQVFPSTFENFVKLLNQDMKKNVVVFGSEFGHSPKKVELSEAYKQIFLFLEGI